MDKEKWKDIDNFKGIYQISNFGRVKSLDRIFKRKNGVFHTIKGKIKKITIANNGYPTVTLCKEMKSYRNQVHRLLAIHFIPNPEKKETVNHINGIKTDNRICNLEWNTYAENNRHAVILGLNKDRSVQSEILRNSRSKAVICITTNKKYKSAKEAEKDLGIKSSMISRVCRGERNFTHGYKFKYIIDSN